MNGSDEFVYILLFILIGVACHPVPTPKELQSIAQEVVRKSDEDRACLTHSSTCEQYVECRRTVALRYGVGFAGRCVP